jgi:uncharacterized protein
MSEFELYINKLSTLLKKNNVCPSHGINHAISVMINAMRCINTDNNTITIGIKDKNTIFKLTNDEKKSIHLAALLHDADDKKFFPNNNNYENLRYILEGESEDLINQVVTMVDLVSSSKNGDRIPDYIVGKEWMLIPRYADRLEAIGIIGIERCFQYGKTTKNHLYVSTTPRPTSINEIWTYASEERYNNYSGTSDSMMDHYFDKLLRVTLFPIRNKYLDFICNQRRQPIIDFVLFFSHTNNMTEKDVEQFIKEYKTNMTMF